MKNFQPLNFEQHKSLGYTEKYGSEYGHQVGAVIVLPNEFAKIQREYPIFFRKDSETGQFFPVALLGFEEKENLFLNEDSSWSTRYIPLSMIQGPFLIGLQQQEEGQKLAIYADLNDSRIQENAGPALFNSDGQASPTLNKVRDILSFRHQGSEQIAPMMEAFLKHNLLEPVTIEIDLANGKTVHFDAGYTVYLEKLMSLESDAVVELHKSGLLSLAYNIADSLNNLQDLINIKNAKMK